MRSPNSKFLTPNSNMRLILASASPRRAELLRAAGYEFEVVAATIDESIHPNESPAMYVRRLAADKSAWAQAGTTKAAPHVRTGTAEAAPHGRELFVGPRFSGAERIVLGADTAVVVDTTMMVPARAAARAVASSPSGWASR